MKLLIDGYSKQVRALASNIRFCNNLEILVYDPNKIQINNFDLYLLQNLIQPELEVSKTTVIPNINIDTDFVEESNGTITYISKVNTFNNSYIKSTLDINKAIEWCDCYACTDYMEYDLITSSDYESTAQSYTDKLNRIQLIKSLGKKLYLSHRLDKLFAQESKYDNMLNTVIDKSALEHIRSLTNGVVNCQSKETDIKLVIGVYSGSGKFSLALRMKEFYDTRNERTGIIFTENTADLINSNYIENNRLDDSLIINCSREWCDLTLDEYIEYVQHCVAYLEQRGCKHILLQGQGSYGIHEMNKYYINENSYLMNINNVILEHAIGCKTVAIAACIDMMDKIIDTLRYFQLTKIKLTDIYLNTYNHSTEYNNDIIKIKGASVSINKVLSMGQLMITMDSIASIDSNINFYTSDFNSYLINQVRPVADPKYHDSILNEALTRSYSDIKNNLLFYKLRNITTYKYLIEHHINKLKELIKDE